MVVRITRIILLVQFIAGLLIAFALHRFLDLAILAAVSAGMLAVVLVRLAINANNFRLARRYGSEVPEECRLNLWQALKMYAEEFASSMQVSSWHMPFCKAHDFHCAESPCPPILLIHGYGCNGAFWYRFSQRLRQEKISHRAIDLEPVFGRIEDYVPAIHEAIETFCRSTGRDQVVIVAHSMGGIAARAYLCTHGIRRVARLITVGSPHHGTGLAQFAKGENSAQMRWMGNSCDGSPCEWLCQLGANEATNHDMPITSIYSRHDNIVSPQESARLPGARNIALHGIGHVALGLNRRVHNKILEEVNAMLMRSNKNKFP